MRIVSILAMCDVCGEREQTLGGFISGDNSGGGPSITRTCDECHKLTFEEAEVIQRRRKRSGIVE